MKSTHFPENLKRLRLSLNQSQEEFAKTIGYRTTRPMIATYERENHRTPKDLVLKKILKLAGVTEKDFFNKEWKSNVKLAPATPDREMTIRLVECVDMELRHQRETGGKITNYGLLYESLGYSGNNYSKFKSGVMDAPAPLIRKFCLTYHYSANYIMLKIGSPKLADSVFESYDERLERIEKALNTDRNLSVLHRKRA